MQQAVIELIGTQDAGKTTLAIVLGEELASTSVLYVDASIDQRLTEIMAPERPALTLAQLIQQAQTDNREAIDWAFHDLAVSVGDEADLLTVGALPEQMETTDESRLRYGLSRLADAYDYVIVDGFHPLLHRCFPEDSIRTVLVLTAEHAADSWPDMIRTPAVILNRHEGEAFPTALDQALAEGQAALIGKLPEYATAEECIRRLPEDFKNCLLRLDIPLNFSHSEQF